jgi:undecaprenyl-diphosphatase
MRDVTTTLDPPGDAPVSTDHLGPAPVPVGRGASLAAASALLGTAFVVGALLAVEPGENAFDRWGFTVFSTHLQNPFFNAITDLGLGPVTSILAVVAGLSIWRRDRLRTVTCLAGPLLAVTLAEVLKVIVGRRLEHALCWPSGSATAVAAIVTVVVLVTRGPARWVAAILGTAAVILEIIALVAFRWHYLSDALGGVLVGVGSVLLIDALLHRLGPRSRLMPWRRVPSRRVPPPV